MSDKTVVSPPMRGAIYLARNNNNKLICHGKAYWAEEGWNRITEHYSTRTIDALVQRGFFTVTKTKLGTSKGRPAMKEIEITLTEKARFVQ